MSLRHRLALGGGVVAAAYGLAVAVDPGLAGGTSVDDALVLVVGGLALLYAGVPAYRRRTTERRGAAGPDPEPAATPDPPGADLDRLLAAAGRTDPRTADRRHRLRRRLVEAATDAVRRHENCDAETARRMLTDGTWTDDPVAASYFADGPVDVSGADLSLPRRLRLRVSARARRAYATHRVAETIAALTDPGADR